MGKLTIGPEGFVDLRRNPPATTVTVQGFTPETEPPKKIAVETLPEPPAEPREEALPAIQKTADGLQQSVAGPVKARGQKPTVLHRIESASGEKCYAIVSRNQFDRLHHWHWIGTKTGHMYRKIKSANGAPDTIVWLHREASNCNRSDRFVAFLDGDERNLLRTNIRIVDSKEEAKAIRRQALGKVANG